MSGGQVDPGLDDWHLAAPPLGLLRAGRTPRLDDPGPVKDQSGAVDAQLGSSSELVTRGEVCRVMLQGFPRLVQHVGGRS